MAATTEKWVEDTNPATTKSLIAGTALNALANNALVIGSAFNNVQSGGGADGFVFGRITCSWKFQSSPSANTAISLWFIKSGDDGGTYEDGGTSVTPARPADLIFGPVPADTSLHSQSWDVMLPPGVWKPLLKNDGTGQSFTASNTDNTLVVTPFTRQAV